MMSRPIDIPGKPSKRPKRPALSCAPPSSEGPVFGMIEIVPSGDVHWMISSGSTDYVEVAFNKRLPPLAFVVEKDCVARTITVEIISTSLRRSINSAILGAHVTEPARKVDFELLIANYGALKSHMQYLEAHFAHEDLTAEMRLLVSDLLPERALYEGVGLARAEGLEDVSILLQDVHHKAVCAGLDHIGYQFSLGNISDDDHAMRMHNFNAKFLTHARSGDYLSLQDLCEPMVKSGEVMIHSRPDFLLEILNKAHVDTFLYVLNIVERTQVRISSSDNTYFPDVTFEPMYVSIRLGHVPTVELFVHKNHFFEGHMQDSPYGMRDQVYTPLFAAVFWDKEDIARLLLSSGPIYFPGYHQAVAYAFSKNLQNMICLLLEHQALASPSSLINSFPTSWTTVTNSIHSNDMLNISDQPNLKSQDISHSFSGIASGLTILKPSPPFSDPIDVALSSTSTVKLTHELSSSAPVFSSTCTDSQNSIGLPGDDVATETTYHRRKREESRAMVARLKQTLVSISCFQTKSPRLKSDLQVHFSSPDKVWRSGIDNFRKLIQNETPASLIKALQCLVLVDAIACQQSHHSASLQNRLFCDLERWRSILCQRDQQRLDDVSKAIWGAPKNERTLASINGTEGLYAFQELSQNVVRIEETKPSSACYSSLMVEGTRLRDLQARRGQTQDNTKLGTHPNFDFGCPYNSIDNGLGRLTVDDNPLDEPFDLSDFIHMEKLEAGSPVTKPHHTDSISQESIRPLWKPVDPGVVVLLASVAFTVVLLSISNVSKYPAIDSLDFEGHLSDYDRASAVFHRFLEIESPTQPEAPLFKVDKSKGILAMKFAATAHPLEAANLLSFSSSASPLAASFGSLSDSSFLSPSPAASRNPDRLQCGKCSKSFSSVSNRNKHVREGCSFREKGGYKCRKEGCTKVLTTRWYRNTHEEKRCHFR